MRKLLKCFHGLCVFCALLSVADCYADPRIYNYVYDKEFVYPIYTMAGEAFLVQLEHDENFKSENSAIGIGDIGAWKASVRGNGVLFKPVGTKPNTNLIVVTNKRTYAFEIVGSSAKHRPTYVVRFRYPDTEAYLDAQREAMGANQQAQTLAYMQAQAAKDKAIQAATSFARPVFNPKYSWIGNHSMISPKMTTSLKPTAAYDDGRFTHLVYDSSVSMPNFYKLSGDGTEALLNTNIDPSEPNTVVIQEVLPKIIVRLGKEVMEITNDAYVVPVFNTTGTGDFNSLRVIRGDSNNGQ